MASPFPYIYGENFPLTRPICNELAKSAGKHLAELEHVTLLSKEVQMKETVNEPTVKSPIKDLAKIVDNVQGGIVIPAAMYFMGVPLVVVVLAWLLFFRG